MSTVSAYSLTIHDWEKTLHELGASRHTLPFFLDGLYRDETIWAKHISKKILKTLTERFDFSLPSLSSTQEASDGTVKFLVRFSDGMEVETVLIPFHKRFTVCLSTQVGCAMNCSFCYTGTQGLKRNLSAGEIVGQYLLAKNWLFDKSSSALNPSIVFMGQGEPLQNLSQVNKAIQILNEPAFFGVSHRQMTLSTVGYLPGLLKINEEKLPPINLALSLHSPFEEERNELIPVNQRFPLLEVMKALDERPLLPRQFITFEYLLIKNFNMTSRHADALRDLLGNRKAIMNLIPFNPFPGSKWERPSVDEIEAFKEMLVERKLRVMVRTTKGSDILAACGQLKVDKLARVHGS